MKRRHPPIIASRLGQHQTRAVCRDPARGGKTATDLINEAWLTRLAEEGAFDRQGLLKVTVTNPLTGERSTPVEDRRKEMLWRHGAAQGRGSWPRGLVSNKKKT